MGQHSYTSGQVGGAAAAHSPRRARWPGSRHRLAWKAASVGAAFGLASTLGITGTLVTAIPSATPALAQVSYQRAVTFTNTSNPDPFGGSNDFLNCLRVATFGGTAPLGADAYLPPNTEIVKIVATGAAGNGGSRPAGGSSPAGNSGNGAQVTAAFPFNAGEELTTSPGATDRTANQDYEGLGGTSPGDGVGGNAAIVAVTDVTVNGNNVTVNGLGECGYSASHVLVVAGGGGGGGQSALLHPGGNAGNAGDDSTGGIGQNGSGGGNNGINCGAGGGGGGGSLSAGGSGGGGGSCALTTSGNSGTSGTFLTHSPQTEPPATSGDGAGGSSAPTTVGGGGGGGGGGYYEGGGGGGSAIGAAGGGGGGGSSFIASSAVPGSAHSIVASNTSRNSSVTITAITTLNVVATDVSYVYGSGPLPALNKVSYNGFLDNDTPSSLGGTLSCTTTATPTSTVGDYAITCSGLTSSNYVIHYIPAKLHILPAASTISMPALSSGTVGSAVTLSATVAAVSPSTATVNEGTVSFSVVDGTGAQKAAAGPASLSGGSASAQLNTSGLADGGYTVKASYAPGKDFTGSNTQSTLFLLRAGVQLASSDVEVVPVWAAPGTGVAQANLVSANVVVAATQGSPGDTLVVAQYKTDPQSVAPPSPVNNYFDVYVPPATTFGLITVSICPPALGSGQVIYWWNGMAWAQVSDQNYNPGTECATAYIQPTGSSPTVAQLSGTPFGEQSTSGSQCNLSTYPSEGGALNLSKATISGCELRKAALGGANLNKVVAIGAYLRDAVLQGANLNGANLTQAYLAGANLTGANLTGANLTGATLSRVQWNNTTCPDGTNSNNDGGTCIGHL